MEFVTGYIVFGMHCTVLSVLVPRCKKKIFKIPTFRQTNIIKKNEPGLVFRTVSKCWVFKLALGLT